VTDSSAFQKNMLRPLYCPNPAAVLMVEIFLFSSPTGTAEGGFTEAT
jgi:hypothetical protein